MVDIKVKRDSALIFEGKGKHTFLPELDFTNLARGKGYVV
jgi:hypothetical protein